MYLPSTREWAAPVFEIGTYFLTALAIWWERDRLRDFHIDRLAFAIIVVGKPLELLFYRLSLPFESPLRSPVYWLYIPISLSLASGFFIQRWKSQKSTRKNWIWLLAGIYVGVTLGVLLGFPLRSQLVPQRVTYLPFTSLFSLPLKLLIFLPFQQMLYAGIAEEPFFRGLLWGALRKAGWKDWWVWLLQAGLFWLGHLYYFGKYPWSFWVIVPMSGLVLGWLAWRSRSIATSMCAHGCLNGFGQIVAFYLRAS